MEAKYGSCELPSGKVLWTQQIRPFVPGGDDRQMFFMIDCYNDGRDHNCAVRTVRNLRLLPTFALELYGTREARNSNVTLVDEFASLANGAEYDHVLKSSMADRQGVVREIRSMGYDGWIGPTDTKAYDVEVCLFDTADVSVIEYNDDGTSVPLDAKIVCVPGTKTFGPVPLDVAKHSLQLMLGWSVYDDSFLQTSSQPQASRTVSCDDARPR